LQADYIELKERRKRRVLTILLDMVFNRTPKINDIRKQLENYDYLLLVAPVWFGKIGTPLRTVFQTIKNTNKQISLTTLSAGADGINPNLEKEIIKRAGIKPKTVINLLISDLLPKNPKPNFKVLDNYKISEIKADTIVDKIINQL